MPLVEEEGGHVSEQAEPLPSHLDGAPRINLPLGSSAPVETRRKLYRPDAAILNFYREGDTLGGHLDDVEPDMDQPIVSRSVVFS